MHNNYIEFKFVDSLKTLKKNKLTRQMTKDWEVQKYE